MFARDFSNGILKSLFLRKANCDGVELPCLLTSLLVVFLQNFARAFRFRPHCLCFSNVPVAHSSDSPGRQSPRAHLHVVGDDAVDVFDINQPSLSTPFNSVLVSISVFTVPSTVLHPIKFPGKSPLSHFGLLVLFLPYWSLNFIP